MFLKFNRKVEVICDHIWENPLVSEKNNTLLPFMSGRDAAVQIEANPTLCLISVLVLKRLLLHVCDN